MKRAKINQKNAAFPRAFWGSETFPKQVIFPKLSISERSPSQSMVLVKAIIIHQPEIKWQFWTTSLSKGRFGVSVFNPSTLHNYHRWIDALLGLQGTCGHVVKSIEVHLKTRRFWREMFSRNALQSYPFEELKNRTVEFPDQRSVWLFLRSFNYPLGDFLGFESSRILEFSTDALAKAVNKAATIKTNHCLKSIELFKPGGFPLQ